MWLAADEERKKSWIDEMKRDSNNLVRMWSQKDDEDGGDKGWLERRGGVDGMRCDAAKIGGWKSGSATGWQE